MTLLDYLVKGDSIMIGDYWYHYDVDALHMAAKAGGQCTFRAQEDQSLIATVDLNQEVEKSGTDDCAYVVADVTYSAFDTAEESEIYIYKHLNIFGVV